MAFVYYRCKSWPCECADGITLICGDCREVLPEVGDADAVVCDPPYGIGEAAGKNKSRGKLAKSRDYGFASWDDEPISRELLTLILGKAGHAIIFGGNYYDLPPTSCWLVWDKKNGKTDFADCELAWTNLKSAVRMISYRWHGMLQEHGGDKKERRVHPTQKPVAVMKWCIQKLPEQCETILDPFAGSGTTLVAAKQLGRKAIGIEIEEKYCKVAAARLRQGVLEFTE